LPVPVAVPVPVPAACGGVAVALCLSYASTYTLSATPRSMSHKAPAPLHARARACRCITDARYQPHRIYPCGTHLQLTWDASQASESRHTCTSHIGAWPSSSHGQYLRHCICVICACEAPRCKAMRLHVRARRTDGQLHAHDSHRMHMPACMPACMLACMHEHRGSRRVSMCITCNRAHRTPPMPGHQPVHHMPGCDPTTTPPH